MKLVSFALGVLFLGFLGIGSFACSSDRTPDQGRTSNSSAPRAAGEPTVTGVNTNFFSAPENLDNAGVWKAVKQAQIPALRFPGGTRGNTYNWPTGSIRANGDVSPEDVRQSNQASMDDFMSRAKRADASVSYVLNITDSPNKIQRLARHWKSTDAPVRWVEMGNEYYSPDLEGSIGGPAGYLERARQALKALRAGGYKGPVGLVVAPEGVLGVGDSDNFRTWNRELTRSDTSGFDAVILHYYLRVEQVGFNRAYEEVPSNLNSVTEHLRRLFPGKQVWITEWNLGPPANDPRFNTVWHALFDLRMIRAMLDNRINLAFYHVLTGKGWELLGPGHSTSHRGSGGAGLSRRVPYFAFQMVNEAQSGGAKYTTGVKLSGGVESMAFRTRDQLRVVAWTLSKGTRTLRVEKGNFSPRFTGGELLHGGLNATNGSALSTSQVGSEKIVPAPINSPQLKGPGAVLLKFSLKNSSG